MPTNYKTVLCLANSRKLSGRCVAGKLTQGGAKGRWIRPVSDRPEEEISEYERQYEDGSDPNVLDLVDIPFVAPRPKAYQPENHLIDGPSYWKKVGTLAAKDLQAYVDKPATLWTNDNSTLAGLNDRVALAEASKLNEGSLYLIDVKDLTLKVFAPGAAFGNPKKRVQGRFTFKQVPYHLWVTDPRVEREYVAKGDGEYPQGRRYLTVSLGEPNKDDFCYKLIAAIIPPS